jgi:hypothetical protein
MSASARIGRASLGEVVAACHHRCIAPINPENSDAWLSNEDNNPATLYAILDGRAAVPQASDGGLNTLAS